MSTATKTKAIEDKAIATALVHLADPTLSESHRRLWALRRLEAAVAAILRVQDRQARR